jgi:outer membrane lipoprotein-sorting protein
MRLVLLSAVLFLAGCKDHRPPAPSAEQAAQLNEAEDMLNDMAANEEGPTDRAPSK